MHETTQSIAELDNMNDPIYLWYSAGTQLHLLLYHPLNSSRVDFKATLSVTVFILL